MTGILKTRLHILLRQNRGLRVSCGLNLPRVVRDRSKVRSEEKEVVVPPAPVIRRIEKAEKSKWTEFLEAKPQADDVEIKISSFFGSIRFDRDNIPKYDGQFDPLVANEQDTGERGLDREKTGAHWEERSSPTGSSSASTESLLFIDSSQINTKPFLAKQISKGNKPKVKDKKKVQMTSKEEDLNYFDELTFKEPLRRFRLEEGLVGRSVALPDVSIRDIDTSDINEIDRQYLFANETSPLSTTQDQSINPLNKLNEKYKKAQQENLQPAISTNIEDLDYIDEQFFGSKSELKPGSSPTNESSTHEKPVSTQQPVINKETPENKRLSKKKDYSHRDQVRGTKPSAALEYVRKLRRENDSESSHATDPVEQIGVGLQSRLSSAALTHQSSVRKREGFEPAASDTDGFVKVDKYSPPLIHNYTSVEVEDLLAGKVLYNDHEIVAVWKPYGLPMFGAGTTKSGALEHSLERYLPFLANKLGHTKLLEVHRLDRTTTGVVLLATSEARRKHLKQLMVKREIVKTYFAITNGVPVTREGIINIPIGECRLGDRFRNTLKPDYEGSKIITNKSNSRARFSPASTEYRVLSSFGSAALVECIILSGIKHQIRVHFGLALNTPILGDNKYSWIDQLGPPQRVKGDIVSRLKLKRSTTRHLPLYLHARRVSIPHVLEDGGKITITAAKPHFFNKVQSKLRLSHTLTDNL